MLRSQINTLILEAIEVMKKQKFYLPPFAFWTPEEWAQKGDEIEEIVDRGLGWDITDFGSGDYERIGLLIFTIRNGDRSMLKAGRGKVYAEKMLLVGVDQVTPFHFHWSKYEDIINRGGGRLAIKVHNATEDEKLADTDVTVSVDGVRRTVPAGTTIVLENGESITIHGGLYHEFKAVDEPVLAGEVSSVNDDNVDNRFLDGAGRFPEIEEDVPPVHLLCTDYAKYVPRGRG